jgi:hypothetical protein
MSGEASATKLEVRSWDRGLQWGMCNVHNRKMYVDTMKKSEANARALIGASSLPQSDMQSQQMPRARKFCPIANGLSGFLTR